MCALSFISWESRSGSLWRASPPAFLDFHESYYTADASRPGSWKILFPGQVETVPVTIPGVWITRH